MPNPGIKPGSPHGRRIHYQLSHQGSPWEIAGRYTNNLRYADNTRESEEELKNLLIKVKEESEKAELKLNIHKTKIMASGPKAMVFPVVM